MSNIRRHPRRDSAPCAAGDGLLIGLGRRQSTAHSAEYPERQITMIVCFPAGGGTDIAARLDQHPARRGPGQAGDRREPRRRRRQYRHCRGRARRRRRLYPAGLLERLRGQSKPLRAGQPTIPTRISSRVMVIGASPNALVVPGAVRHQVAAGVDRAGQGESGQDELDQPRRRHDALPRRRSAQAAHRHQHAAHSLRRRGARRRPPCSAARSTCTPPISDR